MTYGLLLTTLKRAGNSQIFCIIRWHTSILILISRSGRVYVTVYYLLSSVLETEVGLVISLQDRLFEGDYQSTWEKLIAAHATSTPPAQQPTQLMATTSSSSNVVIPPSELPHHSINPRAQVQGQTSPNRTTIFTFSRQTPAQNYTVQRAAHNGCNPQSASIEPMSRARIVAMSSHSSSEISEQSSTASSQSRMYDSPTSDHTLTSIQGGLLRETLCL